MELRPATKDDFDIIFEIFSEVQSIHYDGMPDFFKPAKKDKVFYDYFDEVIENEEKYLIIGFEKDGPFGYIYYLITRLPQTIYRKEKQILYINQLVVKKAYQRRGLGTELINHALNKARKQKIGKIGLDVFSFNEAAVKFFQNQGFTAQNQIMWRTISE